jgi:hypothetical protein
MKYESKDADHGYEISVDARPEDYLWNEWSVHPKYEIGEHEGYKFVYASMPESVEQLRKKMRYRPLSRPTAALFLEFARWPEEEAMDLKSLGSKRNEAAALAWAEINGVLGLDSSPSFEVLGEASDAIQHSLRILGAVRPRTRNQGYGGPQETVEAFAREAWIANMALRLYEAATNPEGPDTETLVNFMPTEEADLPGLPGVNRRSLHGKRPERARSWALEVVEEIVEDRVRGHVWPIPVRDLGGHLHGYVGHKQGWAFESLLGAMWLQMMWLMIGRVRRCEWCGRMLDVEPEQEQGLKAARIAYGRRKPRNDRRFCPSLGGVKNKCKADWNYHRGPGESNKEARRRARQGS